MADPPPQPTTTQIPKEEIVLAGLQKIIETQAATRLETAESFHRVEANLALVSGDVGSLRERVSLLEKAKVQVDERLAKNSDRARNPSAADLELAAKQAEEIAKNNEQDATITEVRAIVTALKSTMVTKDDLTIANAGQTSAIGVLVSDAAKSPLGKQIASEFGRFIIAALTLGTAYLGYLALKGH